MSWRTPNPNGMPGVALLACVAMSMCRTCAPPIIRLGLLASRSLSLVLSCPQLPPQREHSHHQPHRFGECDTDFHQPTSGHCRTNASSASEDASSRLDGSLFLELADRPRKRPSLPS